MDYNDPDTQYDDPEGYRSDEDMDEDAESKVVEPVDPDQEEFNKLVSESLNIESIPEQKTTDDAPVSLPPLSKALIRQGLSECERTLDGSGFAYSRLSLPSCKIRTLVGDLSTYTELKNINLSVNALTEITPLASLTNLVTINVQHNAISGLPDLEALKTLQLLQADDNLITSLSSFRSQSLYGLTLCRNRITSLKDLREANVTFPAVKVLDLSFNGLTSLIGIEAFPNLVHLNVAGNKLTSIAGIHKLSKLQSVDFSDNQLGKLAEFRALSVLKDLDTLIITRNPGLMAGLRDYVVQLHGAEPEVEVEYEDNEQVLLELILMMPTLKRIDARIITHIERAAAHKLEDARVMEKAAKLAIVEHSRAEQKIADERRAAALAQEEEEARRFEEEMLAAQEAEAMEGDIAEAEALEQEDLVADYGEGDEMIEEDMLEDEDTLVDDEDAE